MCCYLTRTTKKTHQLIKENLHETPTYGGWVEAKGPRYCPSIEDKVHSFFLFYFLHHDSFNIVAESSVNYFVDIHFICGQFHYTDFLFFR